MTFSPYYIIIAIGCFAGAALMFTKLRNAIDTSVSIPIGVLFSLCGVYILCREFISGFAESTAVSWAAQGVLVVFLVYLLLSYNNVRAQQNSEFDEEQDADDKPSDDSPSPDASDESESDN